MKLKIGDIKKEIVKKGDIVKCLYMANNICIVYKTNKKRELVKIYTINENNFLSGWCLVEDFEKIC